MTAPATSAVEAASFPTRGFASLPRRSGDVVASLPEPFTASMVDYLPRSVAWWKGRWVVSTTAWGGRDLAVLDAAEGWSRLPSPAGWARSPLVGDDGVSLACVMQDPSSDTGRLVELGADGRWIDRLDAVELDGVTDWDGQRHAVRSLAGHAAALDARGRTIAVDEGRLQCSSGVRSQDADGWSVGLPAGCTVTSVASSPSRELVLVVLRSRSAYQAHVFRTDDGRSAGPHSCREVLQPVSVWLDEDRVVLVREAWPSTEPIIWDWRRGTVERAWSPRALGTVRSIARSTSGEVAYAASTFDAARRLQPLEGPPPVPAEGSGRAVVLEHGGQAVPCVVHDPPGPIRATCLVFPGGPHEPVWAEYAPLAEVLTAVGWRVVKVNVRSSGLRQERYRPAAPFRYGVDDAADACAAWRELAVGPVVTLGMSYGGYIASVCAETIGDAAGAVILAGFLSPCDLVGTRHAGVREFATVAFGAAVRQSPRTLTRPHFVAHGELDSRIPLAALWGYRGAGITFVALPGEGHGIHTDTAARVVYPQMIEWMEERVS